MNKNNQPNYQEFYEKIKTLIRNLGKSNMIHRDDIQELIEEYEVE